MKLQDAIQAKIQGREIAMPQEQQGNALDLMEALQRSLAQQPNIPNQPQYTGFQ